LVEAEVRRAGELHAPLANNDEALSVLLEEVHEVEQEVFKKASLRSDDDLRTELVQVAAMARRWVECCGHEVVLRARFPYAVKLVLAFLRRNCGPANSDHEGLTRLTRLTNKVTRMSDEGGPDLQGRQYDVALALAAVGATCQRWAEDRGLVPRDPTDPVEPPTVAARTVEAVTVTEPIEPPEPGLAASEVTPGAA
jgi:hypothetical protein